MDRSRDTNPSNAVTYIFQDPDYKVYLGIPKINKATAGYTGTEQKIISYSTFSLKAIIFCSLAAPIKGTKK